MIATVHNLTEYRSVTSQKFKFVKSWDWLAYPERTRTKKTLAKNQPASANWWENIAPSCSDNSIRIFLKLAWFVTFMIQAYFRRVHLESWEHKGAYTLPPCH